MSNDIQIYSVLLPEGHASISSLHWQIAVHGPFVLELEDIPSQVRIALPGVQYRLDLHLEGSPSDSAYVRFRSLAQRIARQNRGGKLEFSLDLSRRLRARYGASAKTAPSAVDLSGVEFFCPGCGIAVSKDGEYSCSTCGISLRPILHALIELHPHGDGSGKYF